MIVPRGSFCTGKRVWIAMHSSPTGSAIVRRLWREQCDLVLTSPSQLDLRRRRDLEFWMKEQRPNAVILSDGYQLGGRRRADGEMPRATRLMVGNVLATADRAGVERLVHIVPGFPRPLLFDSKGSTLLSPLRGRGRGAAPVATHAILLTEDYAKRRGGRFVALGAPTVYAPDWSPDWGAPHFLPALVSSLGLALLRGARRLAITTDYALLPPMMHAEDLGDAAVFAADHGQGCAYLRCGPLEHTPVDQLVRLVADVVGFGGHIEIRYRSHAQVTDERPAGRSIESLGWTSRMPLCQGILELYHAWFTRQIAAFSGRNFQQ